MAVLIRARAVLCIASALACLADARLFAGQAAPAIESSVKAVFLFNFAKYVTWPALTGISERSPAEIRVCVTADDAFFAVLKATVHDEVVDGRPLSAVSLDGLDEARTCQILYIGDTRTPDARAWLTAVRGRQVLTVGDHALVNDVVIAFVKDEKRIRFDISRAAGGRQHLNISSKLLRLARQVRQR